MSQNKYIPVPNVMIPLHEMQGQIKHEICLGLDTSGLWVELAALMQFDFQTINKIKKVQSNGNSPSEYLITLWSTYGHYIVELFVLLSKLHQYDSMKKLVDFVHPDYRRLILTSAPTPPSYIIPEEFKTLPTVSIDDLREATNDWDTSNLLGKGGFGSVVKGNWKNTDVAIKRIICEGKENADFIKTSLNEMRFLIGCRHDNILPLYGYQFDEKYCHLVMQLMKGGSLEKWLYSKAPPYRPLSWTERLKIADGTAKGLQFLHNYKEKPLIHGDIKPDNILLDETFVPKIADFGLSREGTTDDEHFEVSRVFGTRPFLPAEFKSQRICSTKVDVFSFGIVLYQLGTGYRAFDGNRKPQQFLDKYMQSEGMNISNQIDKSIPLSGEWIHLYKHFTSLARLCTAQNPLHRPEMEIVFKNIAAYTKLLFGTATI